MWSFNQNQNQNANIQSSNLGWNVNSGNPAGGKSDASANLEQMLIDIVDSSQPMLEVPISAGTWVDRRLQLA